MVIIMGILTVIILVFFCYELYKRRTLNQVEPESPQMRKKINVYKQQENNRLIVCLMIAVIVISVLLMGILFEQQKLKKQGEADQAKIETVSKGETAVKEFKDSSLKLADFPWAKAAGSDSAAALTDYELQLSRDWKPFFGEISVVMIRSQKTQSLTLSVFSSSLKEKAFKVAEKNAEKMVAALNKSPEVMMIDFNFTYHDKANTLAKQSMTYSRAAKDVSLERLKLDK